MSYIQPVKENIYRYLNGVNEQARWVSASLLTAFGLGIAAARLYRSTPIGWTAGLITFAFSEFNRYLWSLGNSLVPNGSIFSSFFSPKKHHLPTRCVHGEGKCPLKDEEIKFSAEKLLTCGLTNKHNDCSVNAMMQVIVHVGFADYLLKQKNTVPPKTKAEKDAEKELSKTNSKDKEKYTNITNRKKASRELQEKQALHVRCMLWEIIKNYKSGEPFNVSAFRKLLHKLTSTQQAQISLSAQEDGVEILNVVLNPYSGKGLFSKFVVERTITPKDKTLREKYKTNIKRPDIKKETIIIQIDLPENSDEDLEGHSIIINSIAPKVVSSKSTFTFVKGEGSIACKIKDKIYAKDLNDIICFSVKRFKGKEDKKTNEIIFSTPTIQIGKETFEYKAFLIHHSDDTTHGHYTAVIKIKEQWYHFNDSVVEPKTEEQALGLAKDAYFIVLKKIKPKQPRVTTPLTNNKQLDRKEVKENSVDTVLKDLTTPKPTHLGPLNRLVNGDTITYKGNAKNFQTFCNNPWLSQFRGNVFNCEITNGTGLEWAKLLDKLPQTITQGKITAKQGKAPTTNLYELPKQFRDQFYYRIKQIGSGYSIELTKRDYRAEQHRLTLAKALSLYDHHWASFNDKMHLALTSSNNTTKQQTYLNHAIGHLNALNKALPNSTMKGVKQARLQIKNAITYIRGLGQTPLQREQAKLQNHQTNYYKLAGTLGYSCPAVIQLRDVLKAQEAKVLKMMLLDEQTDPLNEKAEKGLEDYLTKTEKGTIVKVSDNGHCLFTAFETLAKKYGLLDKDYEVNGEKLRKYTVNVLRYQLEAEEPILTKKPSILIEQPWDVPYTAAIVNELKSAIQDKSERSHYPAWFQTKLAKIIKDRTVAKYLKSEGLYDYLKVLEKDGYGGIASMMICAERFNVKDVILYQANTDKPTKPYKRNPISNPKGKNTFPMVYYNVKTKKHSGPHYNVFIPKE